MHDEYKRAANSIPGLLWTALPGGSVDFVNRGWCHYTGLSPDEAMGSGWQGVIHPEDGPRVAELWRSLPALGKGGEIELRIRRFDGRFRWFYVSIAPLTDERATLLGWFGHLTDIDRRKRAERLLAAEHQVLEMVGRGHPLEKILDSVCRRVEEADPGCCCSIQLFDPKRRVLQHIAAPSLPTEYGLAVDAQPLGSNFGPYGMAIHLASPIIVANIAQDPAWIGHAWGDLTLGSGLQSCEVTPILSSVNKVLGLISIYRREIISATETEGTPSGDFSHIAGISIERSQSDEALRRSEEFLRETQRLSATGSFSWRVCNDQIEFSPETFRIYQMDPNEPVTPEGVFRRVFKGDHALLQDQFELGRLTGGDLEFEERLLMPDGTIRYVRIVARSNHAPLERREYRGAVQDVTELRLAEAELNKTRTQLESVARTAILDEFGASIAHEVSQPLVGILTNASTALRQLAADPPNLEGVREAANRIIRDAGLASDVVTRVRSMFASSAPVLEELDLNGATQEMLSLMWHDIQSASVFLRTDLSAGLPIIMGDRIQLQQVIVNLLRNALDAMRAVHDRERQLTLRTWRDLDADVRLSVQDSGVGFPREGESRLFESFYTSKKKGMGIGLSISRFIVQRHGGRIWAKNNDGFGATVGFAIPLPKASVEPGSGQEDWVI